MSKESSAGWDGGAGSNENKMLRKKVQRVADINKRGCNRHCDREIYKLQQGPKGKVFSILQGQQRE